MSWRDAPLYIEAHDLTRWVVERATTWAPPALLAPPITAATTDLLTSVALALTFVEGRVSYLHRADEAVVRLRMLLRVARDVGLLSPGGHRFAAGRLRTIGRMLGGWLRRLSSKSHPASEGRGEGEA